MPMDHRLHETRNELDNGVVVGQLGNASLNRLQALDVVGHRPHPSRSRIAEIAAAPVGAMGSDRRSMPLVRQSARLFDVWRTATKPHTLTTHATTADSGDMTTDRLPNSQEEAYLREHDAATFIEAVSDARRDSVDTVRMTVKAFAGEPDVLYVALDYAYHSGMSVTMAPDPGQDAPSS
jgi:hypothetical protein